MVFGFQYAEWTSSQPRTDLLGWFMAFFRRLRTAGFCAKFNNRKFIGCPCSRHWISKWFASGKVTVEIGGSATHEFFKIQTWSGRKGGHHARLDAEWQTGLGAVQRRHHRLCSTSIDL